MSSEAGREIVIEGYDSGPGMDSTSHRDHPEASGRDRRSRAQRGRAGRMLAAGVLAWACACGVASPTVAAEPAASRPAAGVDIAVLYPDIGDPYRGVFLKMLAGIEEKAAGRVLAIPVGSAFDASEVGAQLRQQNVHAVIALGRHGVNAAGALGPDAPSIVAGAVLSVPEQEAQRMRVLSLAPAPGLMFEHLRSLMPQVRRVFVVFDPEQSRWLIQRAREAARRQGLELVAEQATDLKAAFVLYQQFFAAADPRRDALWLTQDARTVDDSVILPWVLQQSWDRGVAMFSSNLGHVRRGALFSLYPDNVALGRELAGMAQERPARDAPAEERIRPLTEVRFAVNVRTAAHLGLDAGSRRQAIDLVFPEP